MSSNKDKHWTSFDSGNIEEAITVVRDNYNRRTVGESLKKASSELQGQKRPFAEIKQDVMHALRNTSEGEIVATDLATLYSERLNYIKGVRDGSVKNLFWGTGFRALDNYFSYQLKHMNTIAGGSSVGKSTVIFNMAIELARQQGIPSMVIDMENPSEQIGNKAISWLNDVSYRGLLDPTRLDDSEVVEIDSSLGPISEAFKLVKYVNKPRLSIEELESLIAFYKEKYGIRVFFIDHRFCIKVPDHLKSENQQAAYATNGLEYIALNQNICPGGS